MPEQKANELAVREELAPEVLRPVASPDQLVEAFKVLQEIKRKLITEEDLYVDERGRDRLKISGWRKFGVAFAINLDVVREVRLQDTLNPDHFTWRIGVAARARGGREVIGVGSFSSREIRFKVLEDGSIVHPTKTDKRGEPIPVPLEHIVYSRAHTRAVKRAVQDMIGPVEQEEEELEEPIEAASKTPTPTPPSTSLPRTTAQQRVDAGQRAIMVRFLEDVLGDDLVELLRFEEKDGELLVVLENPIPEATRTRFLKGMMNVGQGVHESARGLVARMVRPKG